MMKGAKPAAIYTLRPLGANVINTGKQLPPCIHGPAENHMQKPYNAYFLNL